MRLALTVLGVLIATSAHAQAPIYTGLLTGHLGASAGGDVEGRGLTPGVSISVTDPNGIGAELDIGHSREIDETRFSSSAITSFTVNAINLWRVSALRPFVVGGIGALRVRAELPDVGLAFNRTDWAFDAGGGVFYMLNDAFAVRGDVRYFRFFNRSDDLPLGVNGGFFDFWRTSIGATYVWPLK